MKFWWVNHKQTYKEEISGGYIWSPTKKADGSRNTFYENMTRVTPGDIIFSYADTKIKNIGFITTECQNGDRPQEFGSDFPWDKNGYKVEVKWTQLENAIKPKNFLSIISPLLPSKYSPINNKGNGNQVCYLASLSSELGNLLLEIASQYNSNISAFIEKSLNSTFEEPEQDEYNQVLNDETLTNTQKQALVNSRRGQGLFRKRVIDIEKKCRVTEVDNPKYLIASHIKPWKESNNSERLDGNNGFLLSPHIDKLFDKGYITFTDNGTLKYTKDVESILLLWKIDVNKNYGPFNKAQKVYLKYHRDKKFDKK